MVIIFFIILLILSAFFSGSETAFLSLNRHQIKKIEESNPYAASRIISVLSKPRQFLLTILTGNSLVNIAATSYATMIAVSYFGKNGIGVAICVMFVLILVFGEVLPKTFSYICAEQIAKAMVGPITFLIKVLTPIRKLLYLITDRLINKFGFIAPKDRHELSEDELKSLISIGHREGVIKESEKDMIYGVFDFKDLYAKDIMTPRIDIKALDFDEPHDSSIASAKRFKHSRLPVYRDSLDNIVGITHAKDILLCTDINIKDLLGSVYFVPESEKIHKLLSDLQKKSIQMAIVTDEYGATVGLVTMEDILEEIVGEIVDEYDKETELIVKLSENKYKINGMLRIEEANDRLGLKIESDKIDTMGGFVTLLLQKIPSEREEIAHQNVTFKILKMDKNRIKEIEITIT